MENSSAKSLRLLYYRYKDTQWFSLSIAVFILLIIALLIGRVVFPQVQNWLSIQNEVASTRQRLEILRSNEQQVQLMNDAVLNTQLQTVTSALPVEKDFTGVLGSVAVAGAKAGVSFDDYTFQVGPLSTKAAALTQDPSIELSFIIRGSLESIILFLKEISEKVPLSQVVSVDYTETGANISLLFFYKVIPERIPISYTEPMKQIQGNNATLLQTLGRWKEDSLYTGIEIPATESAQPFN
jgi:Tfp pilus assembly protein PilO